MITENLKQKCLFLDFNEEIYGEISLNSINNWLMDLYKIYVIVDVDQTTVPKFVYSINRYKESDGLYEWINCLNPHEYSDLFSDYYDALYEGLSFIIEYIIKNKFIHYKGKVIDYKPIIYQHNSFEGKSAPFYLIGTDLKLKKLKNINETIGHHLYFLSDEFPRLFDFVFVFDENGKNLGLHEFISMHKNNKFIVCRGLANDKEIEVKQKLCKPIVATTNRALRYCLDIPNIIYDYYIK